MLYMNWSKIGHAAIMTMPMYREHAPRTCMHTLYMYITAGFEISRSPQAGRLGAPLTPCMRLYNADEPSMGVCTSGLRCSATAKFCKHAKNMQRRDVVQEPEPGS